ncbi:MAG: hypothetical protein WC023_06290 [Rhodocyclaceae bacterium]
MDDTLPALLAEVERSMMRAVCALAHAIENHRVTAYESDYDAVSNALALLRAWNRRPAANGEAVAWRYRIQLEGGEWGNWSVSQSTAWSKPFPAEEQIEVQPLYTAPPPAVPAGWTEDDIAHACMMAEVPDSKCESILIALASLSAPTAGKGETK